MRTCLAVLMTSYDGIATSASWTGCTKLQYHRTHKNKLELGERCGRQPHALQHCFKLFTSFCAHMHDCTHSRMQECTIASLRAQACAHVHTHAWSIWKLALAQKFIQRWPVLSEVMALCTNLPRRKPWLSLSSR